MASERSWSGTFRGCVQAALDAPELTPATVRGCLEVARTCDPTDPEQVQTALIELMRLAERTWPELGRDTAEEPILLAMNITLAVYVETGDPRCIVELAESFQRRGHQQYAIVMYEKAVGIPAPSRPEVRPTPVAVMQNNLGNALRQVGRLNQAEAALCASLDAIDQDSPEVADLLSAILNNLALVHISRKDSQRARDALIESLKAAERAGTDPIQQAITLDNLAQTEITLGRQSGPLKLQDGYVNGTAAEHFHRAEEYLSDAQEALAKGLPQTSDDYVTSLINSAEIDVEWERNEAAAAVCREAMEIVDGGGVSRANVAILQSLRGKVLLAGGNPTEAVALLRPLLDDATEMAEHDVPPRLLTTAMCAAALLGDRELTEQTGRMLTAVDDQTLNTLLHDAPESVAQRVFFEYGDRAQLVVGHCLHVTPGPVVPAWVYEVVLNRKGVLAERQGSAWLRARAANPHVQAQLEKVKALRTEVSRVDLDAGHGGAIQSARRAYSEALSRLEVAERQLHEQLGDAELGLSPASLEEIQERIDEDTLLLDFSYAQGPDRQRHYVMFLISGEGPAQVRDLGEVGIVDRRITELTDLVGTKPSNSADREQRASAIRQLAAKALELDMPLPKRLLLAPTGLWGRVPFGLLLDSEGVPLIERHEIGVLPSARWLLKDNPEPTHPGPPLVIGDPDFDLDLDFDAEIPFFLSIRESRLPHAAKEVRDVARLLGVKPLHGPDATRAALLSVQSPRILHVASHGGFLDAIGSLAEKKEPHYTTLENVEGLVLTEEHDISEFAPANDVSGTELHERRVEWLESIGPTGQLSRSTVLLAGFNRWVAGAPTTEDVGTGIVSAGEFALLDLSDTALVVLSACETGVGAVDYADGSLMGLRAAGLAAGADCCITSLWKVDDARTADLMSGLYQRLPKAASPSEALRLAQLDLCRNDPDPYFWAGWVAEGGFV